MSSAVLSSDGKATIPKPVREHLRLQPGDRIEFVVQDNGSVVLIPRKHQIADLQDILPRPPRAATLDEMDEGIARHVAELDRASRR